MLEMQIASLEASIVAKLDKLKNIDVLTYHKRMSSYKRLRRDFKRSGMLYKEDYLNALERLLEGLNDVLGGN